MHKQNKKKTFAGNNSAIRTMDTGTMPIQIENKANDIVTTGTQLKPSNEYPISPKYVYKPARNMQTVAPDVDAMYKIRRPNLSINTTADNVPINCAEPITIVETFGSKSEPESRNIFAPYISNTTNPQKP